MQDSSPVLAHLLSPPSSTVMACTFWTFLNGASLEHAGVVCLACAAAAALQSCSACQHLSVGSSYQQQA